MKKFLCLGATLALLGGVNYYDLASVAFADENQEIEPLPLPDANSSETETNPAIETTTPSNQVILIEPGSEPRQQLRFTPVVNSKETTEVTMAMDINAIVDGVSVPEMPYPSTIITILTEITDIDAEGNIYINFAYQDVRVAESDAIDPITQETIEQQLAYLEEFEGQLVVDSRGQILDSQINLPQGVDPFSQQLLDQIVGSLEQSSHPFPTEPVGVGAVWQVVSSIDAGFGFEVQQTATYQLVKLYKQQATLEVTVEQEALTKSISLPEFPPDMSVDLTNFSSSGNGRIIMNLERTMPLASTLYLDTEISMAMQPNSGQELTMQMNTQFQMDMLAQP